MSNVFMELHVKSDNVNLVYRGYTNNDGLVKFLYVVQGNYTIDASFRDLVQQEHLTINQSMSNYYLQFYINIKTINENNYLHYNAFRQIKIDNPSQYVQTFLQSTFSIFVITMLIAVFITIFFMFLSMESIITFPLYQHKSDINSLRLLGASKQQISIVLSLKLAYYSFFASFLGIITSTVLLFSVSSIGSSNFGGLIFSPKIDPIFTIISVIFIFVITFIISYNYLQRSLLPILGKISVD